MSRISRLVISFLVVLASMVGSSIPVLAAEQADLNVSSIETTTLYAGIASTVVVNINNQTDVAADGFTVILRANGVEVDSVESLSISGNNDPYYWPLGVYFYWTPAEEGSYTLQAVVDTSDSVYETDETNNATERIVEVNSLQAITVQVRVEGQNETLWSGSVTFTDSTITDKQGETYTIDHPTVLGALDAAAAEAGFEYVVSSSWGALSYIEQVGTDEPAGLNGWLYRVNWNSGNVAAVDYTIADGDEVLFYFGGWSAAPLKLSLTQNEIPASTSFDILVEEYNGAVWSPAANAQLTAGDLHFETDIDGLVADVTLSPGLYVLKAAKENCDTYIRSNSQTIKIYDPLKLVSGWNFISVPRRLAPEYNTTAAVFGEVDTASHSIFKYDPESGWVNLEAQDAILPLEGIWIYSADQIEIRPVFDTNPRAVPAVRYLQAGWNAIGFTDFTACSANSALTSLENEWATLIGFDPVAQAYEVSMINNAPDDDNHSELREMSPWKGYWLFLTADSVLAAISS